MCYNYFRKLVYDDFKIILGFPKYLSYDKFTIKLAQA